MKNTYTTVFFRMIAYVKKHNVRKLTQDEKTEVGCRVRDAWFSQPNKGGAPIHKGVIREDDKKFSVLFYPASFKPIIDSEIAKKYAEL